MIEITEIEDFKKYKAMEGYFIITDMTGRRLLHWHRCADVDISHFRLKVKKNENSTGHYYFTDDLLEGLEYPKIKKCDNCRRFI